MRRLAGILLFSALFARAQSLSYTSLPAAGDAPSPRYDGTIAYDAASRRILLFGGDDGRPRNDLYAYSLDSRRWLKLSPAGTSPPARSGHTAILDSAAQRLIVFGGQASGFFSDVWAYELSANRWTQLAPDQAGPARRYGHSAIYDAPRHRMVISHGFTNSGRFDDTWAFDLSLNRWRDLAPSSPRPLRRCLHHAVYDDTNQRMLLFGGCASGFGPCPLGDLWSFDLVNGGWREIAGAGPPPREHHGMAFDEANQRVMIFSGGRASNDTWAFDTRLNRWTQLSPAGAPSARSRHQGAAIAGRGATVFFGGLTSAGPSNELWWLGAAPAPAIPRFAAPDVSDAFSGQTGGVAPGQLISIRGSDVGPPEPMAFAFDAATGLLPLSAPGLEVRFNNIAAPILYASAGQLNVQVPYEVAGMANVEIAVKVDGASGDAVAVPVFPTRPSLFPRVWNQDGSVNTPDHPAPAGTIVTVFATGHGETVPASRTGSRTAAGPLPTPASPVAVEAGGVAAEVLFAGQAPETTGVVQINWRIPFGFSGAAPVRLRIGNGESASILVHTR